MTRIAASLLIVAAAAAEIPVAYYPYDYCEPVKFVLALDKDKELRRAKDRTIHNYVCGAYSGIFDLTSGHTLHIFPDGRAMIAEWCDICPVKLAAEGNWKIEGDTVVVAWEKWHVAPAGRDRFAASYGQCVALRLYLSFDREKVSKKIVLVSKDKEGPEIETPLVQRTRYVDWKRTADELVSKK